jgi:2-polyprenyl-3-methyl-5-hydroxy-6-metoxy-1,4-benzoquinol methylase
MYNMGWSLNFLFLEGTLSKQQIYDEFDASELGYRQLFEQLLPLLVPGQTALDIGISAGHLCSPIAYAGLKITGVDIDERALNRCQELFVEANLSAPKLVHSDAMTFLDTCVDKFDLVIMSDFLMFLAKTKGREVLRSAWSKINTGGLMWIATKSMNDHYFRYLSSFQAPIDEQTFVEYSHCHGSGPICFYSPEELKALIEDLGGEILSTDENENDRGGLSVIVLARKK